MRVRFLRAAARETEAARLWYAKRSPLAAPLFVSDLDAALATIVEAPHRFPVARPGLRRYVLQRFPYVVFYRAQGEWLEVVAVAHSSRRPGYWARRVRRGRRS